MITVKIVLLIKIIFNLLLKTITIYNIINKSRAISSGDRVADFESKRNKFDSFYMHPHIPCNNKLLTHSIFINYMYKYKVVTVWLLLMKKFYYSR